MRLQLSLSSALDRADTNDNLLVGELKATPDDIDTAWRRCIREANWPALEVLNRLKNSTISVLASRSWCSPKPIVWRATKRVSPTTESERQASHAHLLLRYSSTCSDPNSVVYEKTAIGSSSSKVLRRLVVVLPSRCTTVNHRLHAQIGPTAGVFLIAFVPRDVVSCAADCEYGYLFFGLALIERRRHRSSRHRCHGAEHIRSLTRSR